MESLSVEPPLVEVRFRAYNWRLLEKRKELGYNQKDLSLLAGIPVSRLGTYERLEEVPTVEEMEEISSALQAQRDYLFPQVLLDIVEERLTQPRRGYLTEQNVLSFREAFRLGYARIIPLSSPEEQADKALLKQNIQQSLETLPPREQLVVYKRFFEGKNQKEVGNDLGVTGSRIGQIETQAIRHLRHSPRSQQLRSFWKDKKT